MVAHNKITFDSKELKAITKVVKSGHWSTGQEVNLLEEKLKAVTSRSYAIAVSSGLSALTLSLLALRIKKGDEVIIPAYSCVAIANAVLYLGAKPIPVDVLLNNWTIDPDLVKSTLTSKTKAIIVVNTFGLRAQFEKLLNFGIPIIEDCAHALGNLNGDMCFGINGIISISSFYATKFVGGGEGGAVLTDDIEIANFIYDHRDYSDKMPSKFRLNNKMSDLHASLISCQLEKIEYFIKTRERIADKYFAFLNESRIQNIVFPINELRIWYRFVIYFKKNSATEMINKLEKEGVITAKPVEMWISRNNWSKFPVSKFAFKNLISIPIYPKLEYTEVLEVIRAINIISLTIENGK